MSGQIARLRELREAAEASNRRAYQVVVDLCSGKLRWEMRVPAEPDHDPDLIIGTALRDAAKMTEALPLLLAVVEAAEALRYAWYGGDESITDLAAALDALDGAG